MHGAVVVVALDGGHLEAPVVASLRQTVLDHDHRADVVGALDVAHVVALDAQRRLGHPERCLQLLEGDGTAGQVARPPQAVAHELVGGVLAGRGEELALAAPLRHDHLDLALAEAGEPGLVRGHVLRQLGDEQLAGDPDRRLRVVLLEHPPDRAAGS